MSSPTVEFAKRSAEQAAVAFVLSFGAVVTATGTGFTRAALVAGVTAGARAVYGVLVKVLGPDSDSPSVL